MATLPGQASTIVEDSPEVAANKQAFIDTVESAPAAIAEGFESAKETGREAIDFLVGREPGARDLDAELEALAEPVEDTSLDAELEALAGPPPVDDDGEITFEITQGQPEPPEGPGVGTKILARALGEDVDDPVPFMRLGTTISGGVVGGITGARAGLFFGPFGMAVGAGVGTVVGTGAGSIAPELVQRFVDYTGLLGDDNRFSPENFPLLGPDDLQEVLEGETLLEIATLGVLSAFRTATRIGTQFFSGVGPMEQALAKRAKERGIDLPMVTVGSRPIMRGAVLIFGKFPLISGPIVKSASKAELQLEREILSLPGRLVEAQRTADQLGLAMFRDAKNLAKHTAAKFNKQYDALFKLAEDFDVTVIPKRLTSQASQTVHQIATNTPRVLDKKTGKLVPGKLSETDRLVTRFIKKHIIPVRKTPQTLKQMDKIISKIDEFLLSLEPAQRKLAKRQIGKIRAQGILDILKNARGRNAGEITQRFRNIDKDFAVTIQSLFGTSLAKSFERVTKKGLRASVVDPVTKTPVDKVADLLVKLESPQSMKDMAKIVTPRVYKEIGAKIIQDAIDKSIVDTGQSIKLFDVTKFSRELGLNRKLGNKRNAMKAILDETGGLSMKELDELVEIAKVIENFEIPSASSFVLRRTLLGGTQSFIGSILPGVTAGATARRGIFSVKTLVAISIFLFGGRGLSAALANPHTAQALRDVMSEEIGAIARREAFIKTIRLLFSGLFGDDDLFIGRLTQIEGVEDTDYRKKLEVSWDMIKKSLLQAEKQQNK